MKTRSSFRGSIASLSLAFLVGMAVACASLWPVFSGNEGTSSLPEEAPRVVALGSRPVAVGGPDSSENTAPSAIPETESRWGISAELKSDFIRLLGDDLQSREDEHLERLGLVLGRLRRGGADSVPLIVEYLQSGRDLSPAAIHGARTAKAVSMPAFRTLLMDVLAEIVRANPALAAQAANDCLPFAKTLAEAQSASALGSTTEPEAVRAAAVAAVQRLLPGKPEDSDLVVATEMMGRLRAEELIPVLAAKIAQQPDAWSTSEFLAALWQFPDEARTAAAHELLRRDGVRLNMRINASSYQHLDARDPEFRAMMIVDFAVLQDEQQRGYFVRGLGDKNGYQGFVAPAVEKFSSDARGSSEQARARLSLLDEIAPLCTTQALQAQLAEAREKLTKLAILP